MKRITVGQLESRVKYLNQITGQKEKTWENGKANIGTYYLDGAYSGYTVDQICNESGGVIELFSGHMPKKELYYRLNAYISGIQDGKK